MGKYFKRQRINIEEYQAFLGKVLQAEIESHSNPAVVYPLLQRHQDKLDDIFAQLLQTSTKNALSGGNKEEITFIAVLINNLCINIQQFPLGNRANNLEIAIVGYQTILEVLTCKAFPKQWAMTQNHLGNAYQFRIREEKAENLELAIAAHQKSLTIYTREAFPKQWAMTHINLGNAYNARIRGERAENLELAIAAYQKSLEVLTREAFPEKWARSQTNLGNIYRDRIRGERAENLELAIAAYQKSLEVLTREAFPEEWATTHNNLGVAYQDRIRGKRAENLELAIASCQKSLEVLTHEAFPEKWAMIQSSLAIIYQDRIRGERAENLELAIAACQRSLEIYTREAFPEQWARIQNNLGNVYNTLIKEERAENLELAIAAYQKSLEIHTREAFPEQWARIQNNLGAAYRYFNQIPQAIEAFCLSLEIWTPMTFPFDCLRTGRNLGNTAKLINDWETAIKGYNLAIEAVETSRSWATTPQRKKEIMEAAIDVYMGIVQACINNHQLDRALEYVERSKTRNLTELLANRELYPKGNIDRSILTELDRLRQDIHVEQRRLDKLDNEEIICNSNSQSLGSNQTQISSDRTYLVQLQQELDELIKTKIAPIDKTFSLTQKVETIPYLEIQSLIDRDTAILEFYLTNDNILAFIVLSNFSSKEGLTLWQSSSEDLEALVTWTNEYLSTYYQDQDKKQWKKNLSSRLETLSKILHINDLLKQIPTTIQQLIIIPHRFLHILPFHALPIVEERYNNPILQDRFPNGVNYNPSCQLLKQLKQRQRTDFNHLFAIQNPTEDLFYTDLEVITIQQYFNPIDILIKQAATKSAFNQQSFNQIHCSHFSCHGYFNVNNPLQSALILANAETCTEIKPKVNNSKDYKIFPFRDRKRTDPSKCLTLENIFKLDLPLCRLVTLSACETGLTDTKSLSDEYIGLPSGFLFAGSPNVVSSLWTVSDLSTAFLMMKFYESLLDKNQHISVTVALKKAQKWLQKLTVQEYSNQLNNCQQIIEKVKQKLDSKEFQRLMDIIEDEQYRIKKLQVNYRLFQDPFYWAAFIAIGFN